MKISSVTPSPTATFEVVKPLQQEPRKVSFKVSSVVPIEADLESPKKGETSPQSVIIGVDDVLDRSLSPFSRKLTISSKISEEATYRRALAKAEKKLGPDDRGTIEAVHALAHFLNSVGKLKEAEKLYTIELLWKEKHLGNTNHETVSILHTLGDLQTTSKIFDTASTNLNKALSYREAALGPEHADTMATIASLARLRAVSGQHAHAEELYQRLLRWRKQHFGEDALATIDALQEFAQLLHTCRRYEEAEALYKEALHGRTTSQGEGATQTLILQSRLADFLRDQGRFLEAITLYTRTLLALELSLGYDHELTLDVVHALAVSLEKAGELNEALEMYSRAVDGRERILGSSHADTCESADRLAALYDLLEDSLETPRDLPSESDRQSILAEAPLKKDPSSLSVIVPTDDEKKLSSSFRNSLGLSPKHFLWTPFFHESRLVGATNLKLQFESEGIANAEKVYLAAHDNHVQSGAPNNIEFVLTISRLATVMHSQRKLKDADVMYKKALQIYDALHPEGDDENTLEIMRSFAALLVQRKQLAEAETILGRLIRGSRSICGPEHTDSLFAVNMLAGVLRRQSRFEEAAAMYTDAQQGYEKSLGPDHPYSLSAANDLAVQMCQIGNYEEAQLLLRRTLIGREKALGADHLDTLAVMGNLALVLQIQDDKKDYVDVLYTRALLGIDRKLSDKASELYAGIVYNYAHFCKEQGLTDKSIALLKDVADDRHRAVPKYRIAVVGNVIRQLLALYKELKMTSEEDELKIAMEELSALPERSEFDDEDKKQSEEKNETLDKLPPFPKKGVKIELLRKIRELSEPTWTTTDVSDKLVKPWTDELKCSFAEMMEKKHSVLPHPDLGMTYDECFTSNARVFVSHAWRYEFSCLVEAVETFFIDELVVTGENAGCLQSHRLTAVNTSLWIDLFVNDQWNAPSLPYEWWSGTFLSAIGEIGHTMLVLSPWNDPIPLTRAWCLWEILCTIRTKSKLTVQLSAKHRRQFQEEYRKNENCLLAALSKIDVQKSEAWKADDRDMIFEAVRKTDVSPTLRGFRGVNNLIMDHLRSWATTSVKEMITDPFYKLSATGEKQSETDERWAAVRNKALLAGLYHTQSKLIEAADIYNECILEMRSLTHRHDPELLRLKARLAALYRCARMYDFAQHIYIEIYESFHDSLGKNNPDTLRILSYQAKIFQLKGDLDSALAVYSVILEQFNEKRILPPDHNDTLQIMQNLGQIYSDKGMYDEALEMFRAAFEGYERNNGVDVDHPDTLRTVHGIGIVMQNQKKFIEAELLLTRAHIGLERVLGAKHPEVVKVAANAAALRSYFFKNPFTNFYQKAALNA